jgi:hypothetical protein
VQGILSAGFLALEVKDYNAATGIHQVLLTSFSAEGTLWIIGIKRLLDVAKFF